MNLLDLIGRDSLLFDDDLNNFSDQLSDLVSSSSFLVIGGAGTIGQAVVKQIFSRKPKVLHVVDISENNLVELVRDLRSGDGYISGDFKTFAIDCGSIEFNAFAKSLGPYDYVFNLSALKHVRSEKDPYTLMRMVNVNIFNSLKVINLMKSSSLKNYFCVSTDKAANPVSMMGASKRIMEIFLMRESLQQNISMARFANVAFSDGSLLHGFNQRFIKSQPFSAPKDILRYFLVPQESGELCILSGLLGKNREIFFPKLNEKLHLISFSEIASKYLYCKGYEVFECDSENEARYKSKELIKKKKWPCFFFNSDTSGEKDFEEFYTDKENICLDSFKSIGIIRNSASFNEKDLDEFFKKMDEISKNSRWEKTEILKAFQKVIPEFSHKETGKNLDQKM